MPRSGHFVALLLLATSWLFTARTSAFELLCASEIATCNSNIDCATSLTCVNATLQVQSQCDEDCFGACVQITSGTAAILWQAMSMCLQDAGVVALPVSGSGPVFAIRTYLGQIPNEAFLTDQQQEALKMGFLAALQLVGYRPSDLVFGRDLRGVFIERLVSGQPAQNTLDDDAGVALSTTISFPSGTGMFTFITQASEARQVSTAESSNNSSSSSFLSTTVLIAIIVGGAVLLIVLGVLLTSYSNFQKVQKRARADPEPGPQPFMIDNRNMLMKQSSFFDRLQRGTMSRPDPDERSDTSEDLLRLTADWEMDEPKSPYSVVKPPKSYANSNITTTNPNPKPSGRPPFSAKASMVSRASSKDSNLRAISEVFGQALAGYESELGSMRSNSRTHLMEQSRVDQV
eukprot:m.27537 g.27537  ORF g.27537 m.27537 type:complete len:403 (+) comp11677_c0_seq2:172-1380(+)